MHFFSRQFLLLGTAALSLAACAPAPLRTSLPLAWTPSPSFNERRPSFVILHHTSNDTAARALATLTNPSLELSAHYLVGRDGRLYQLVDERMRAWHAGASSWGGNTDMNSVSIGIELDNTGEEPFAEAQLTALVALLGDLRERYKIPAANFLGHADIAPRRKVDPSQLFPWKRLADLGFGLWCETPAQAGAASGDSASLLQAFGYDVSDLPAAISAFRRHFSGNNSGGSNTRGSDEANRRAATSDLSETERAVAQCLAARKRE